MKRRALAKSERRRISKSARADALKQAQLSVKDFRRHVNARAAEMLTEIEGVVGLICWLYGMQAWSERVYLHDKMCEAASQARHAYEYINENLGTAHQDWLWNALIPHLADQLDDAVKAGL